MPLAIPWTQQIEDLVGAEPRLTMSAISTRLGKNPGGIRTRLIRMTQAGRLIAEPGPDGWTVYRLPTDEERSRR